MCVTTVAPGHAHWASDGMENTEFRKLALQCFLTFKTLAKSHWEIFLEGVEVNPC